MQNNDFRAKQFMPFDALKGFKEAINLIQNKGVKKRILAEDGINNINEKLSKLTKNTNVRIKYYSNIDYISTTGLIKKIDTINKCIYILNSKINFEDILDIDILE